MVVQHNLSAMNANRYLGINNSKLSKSLEKLSSGYAINRAGDNAAGLAVSEKMRSQIAGMTQAVKNAQDGISMVQTFEGALTETDSILQRMKTLADQMANGSYDDPVDRTAAQQEFLQLNDELDQIADTDFNGVVVLNGGTMSDGVKADENGLIDYRAAKAAADAAAAGDAVDIFDNEGAKNILDNSKYGAADAKAIWNTLGLKDDVTDINVTFQYDGSAWNAVAVTDKDGKAIDGAKAGSLKTEAIDSANKGDGGFKITGTSLNAVFDAMDTDGNGRVAKEGDVVSFNFTKPADAVYAPKNAGIKEDSYKVTDDAAATSKIGDRGGVKFTLDAGITDDAMTEDISKALTALKDVKFKLTYDDQGAATLSQTGATADVVVDATTGEIKSKAGTVIGKVEYDATLKTDIPATAEVNSTVSVTGNITGATIDNQTTLNNYIDGLTKTGGGNITFKLNAAETNWIGDDDANTTVAVGAAAATFGITITGTPAANDTLVFTPHTAAQAEQKGAADTGVENSTIEFQIDVDAFKAPDPDATYKANSIKTTDDMKKAAEGGSSVEVSKSDAFKNSEAMMTYKKSIILQAGARTKDAVEFTFEYDSKAIGDLKADLNCTAKGLGTDKLNLKTQADANYAIDKIDQAINKVSLVRGTFGAIQNRLEHKIDNLNVSVENLTSAESQIRDTNMPQEMMNFTKQQILAQASQSMLAQANQLPQGVLSLLQ